MPRHGARSKELLELDGRTRKCGRDTPAALTAATVPARRGRSCAVGIAETE